ncbi:hypothetical protein [Streptobacillus canis]|nr:hypothetical protein [Streptobacillus canis]
MGLKVFEEKIGLTLGEAFVTRKFILSEEQMGKINKVVEKF